ncbi:class I SAM-dependent methyltransferase [Flavilitoribacter nigricans]|uniref:SAM-dependent methyltransferase n=1 Tax=Flavilitoribacter nigricans (strain ATCC 23147 / DSM 23189 / NBRC 102662 / NCIMB 1420 / SS-2) TaxID=1122177 RepID=A0A2D0N0S9_FLAN2|nr:class I SAM-dependent methyltransferase [Flavilitoribacter nigricans]PHN02040.1 SAM-dependent methyltransferase [Flavilitoribacter nigricans DSM 23189 = NBRC 102662]
MAFEFHQDKDRYFAMQRENAAEYVVPFIQQYAGIRADDHVLEVGCAEGGVLQAFLDLGCTGVGVELLPQRLELARHYLADALRDERVELMAKNVYDVVPERDFKRPFDLIVLKDVIEHIPDQEKLLRKLGSFLRPGGYIFLGFPPWQMPFGGHQQICRHRVLSKLPYYHLLPAPAYKKVLEAGGEAPHVVQELLEIKDTGLSIGQFERIARQTNFNILGKQLYLINPIYRYKFNLQPRRQMGILGNVPYLRNFVTTCAYYLIQAK